jgi:hypothetical protein
MHFFKYNFPYPGNLSKIVEKIRFSLYNKRREEGEGYDRLSE